METLALPHSLPQASSTFPPPAIPRLCIVDRQMLWWEIQLSKHSRSERYVVPPTRMIYLAPRFKQWMGECTFSFYWSDEIPRFSSPIKFSAIGVLDFFFFFNFLLFLWLAFDGMMCHELFLYWLFWNSWPIDFTILVHSVLQFFDKIPQYKDNVIFKEFWYRPFMKLAYYHEKSLI